MTDQAKRRENDDESAARSLLVISCWLIVKIRKGKES
jgi:hypothetical protein